MTLKKGGKRQDFTVRAAPDAEKPEILKGYLERFKLTVQRYFPVPAGARAGDLPPVADRYPVFELIPASEPDR